MTLIKLGLRVYRLLRPRALTCRFYPSCSHYAEEVIGKYGLIKGLFLGLKRLLRCNQLFAGGYDPVP